MILYRSSAKTYETETLEVTFEDDAFAAARLFEPELVMAQNASENTAVLQIAADFFAGLGLIEPDLTLSQLQNLDSLQAKIFLLAKDDAKVADFSNYGLVVHDWNTYCQECVAALNNILT